MQRLKTAISTLINLGLPGAGLGITAHFMIQGAVREALASLAVTGCVTLLTLGRKFGRKVLERIEQRLDERADSVGDWLFDQFEVRVQKIWWALSGNFRDRYNQALIYRYRDYRTQGLTNKGPFALNLEKVFVPLQLRPESLSRISSALIRQPELLERRGKASPIINGSTIWAFLAELKEQPAFDRLVILGAPGSGKTTLLEHLTLIYARGKQRKRDRQAPDLIPMLLYLREVRSQLITDEPPNLLALLERQAQLDGLKAPPGWFADQLNRGKALVLLDGLDEVADVRHRKQVSRWVEQQMRRYRQAPFIITSRPSGYRDTPLEGITTLEVRPFDLGQMQRFIHNWYLQNETVRHLGKRDRGVKRRAQFQSDDLMDRISKTPALAAMALNPLLLSMIATVHCFRGALPGRRVELYAEICDVLLGRRQDVKGIPDVLTTSQKRQLLQTLALKLMSRRSRTFKTFAGKVLIQKELDRMAGGNEAIASQASGGIAAENFLQQIEVNSGLLVERHPSVYEFAHKSLQEYLAAQQVKQLQREYLLTRAIEDPWWEETIRLYAAENDASALIWHALQKNSVNALSLAYDCLEEGLAVDKDVKAELGDRLDDGLESNDPAIFELAAEVKLERRLKRLLRLNETTDIDLTYISCAEYQLFLNEQRRDGDACPPDHWAKPRFPKGSALIPVTGLRASDAIAFCHWLTARLNQLGSLYQEAGVTVFSGPITIRLPQREEVEEHPIEPPLVLLTKSNRPSRRLAELQAKASSTKQPRPGPNDPAPMEISCWCMATGDRCLVAQPLPDSPLAQTQATIANQLISLMKRDTGFVFDPILKHALLFSQALLGSQVSKLMNQAFALSPDPLHWGERDRAISQIITLDLSTSLRDGTGLSRDAAGFSNSRNLESNRDLMLHIAEEWSDTGMDKVRQALDRQGRKRPKASRTPLLPAPEILLASAFWQILSGLYSNLAKRRRVLKRNAIIRQDCEFLSSQFQAYSEDALKFYLFMALKDDRRNNDEAVIWEGLRIVRTTRQ